jgi:uncharacterized lipoprotein YmbA
MKTWHRHALVAAALAVVLLLSACGAGPPSRRVYILGGAGPADRAVVSELGLPGVEVTPVRIPDYLDTNEMLTLRSGNRLEASRTAKWGERLSVGVTRAIAVSLAARLPEFDVAMQPPTPARWQLLTNIDTFEVGPDGRCVMAGQWSIWNRSLDQTVALERFAIASPVRADDSAQLVDVMSREVDQLAALIAKGFGTTGHRDHADRRS